MQYTVEKSGTIHLGKQGEHQTRELVFPELAVWEKEYGPGEAEIIFLPSGEKTPVSVTLSRSEGGAWLWTVTAAETACPGYGKCELRYTVGDVVVKSVTYQTFVAESLGEGMPVTGTVSDGTQREKSAGMPLLIDEESGMSYMLKVKSGKLMIQEAEPGTGDEKPVVMEHDRAAPGGVATLNEDGKLAEEQRSVYSVGQIAGLDKTLRQLTGEIQTIIGEGAPGEDTPAAVGQHYLDTGTGREYICVAADGEADVYTWQESGGGGSGNGGGSGGGSIITITFDAEFAGQTFTVSDGTDTVTGIVPDELAASVNVADINSTYTITAELDGLEYVTIVTTGPYFGQYAAALKAVRTYGVRWSGGPETAMSRTDYAESFLEPDPYVADGAHPGWSPFDGSMPWAGMKIVDDPTLGKLVAIPKYWYRWTKTGAVMTLQISDKEQDGFRVSPAHTDRGDGQGERDVVYVGRYHCDENYRSTTGSAPKAVITRAVARQAISKLHAAAWQYDFAMYWTIAMLYLVEFADWDSQKMIGYGGGNGSAAQACGASDNMGYHTGTMQTSRNAYGVGCQYRWIEGLWDNVYDWMDGCYYSSSGLSVIMNPSNFHDTIGGTVVGTPSSGYPTVMSVATALGVDWIYPTAANGSQMTYVPDKWYFDFKRPCLLSGGYYGQNLDHGLFCVSPSTTPGAGADIGCRLQKLPNKEED